MNINYLNSLNSINLYQQKSVNSVNNVVSNPISYNNKLAGLDHDVFVKSANTINFGRSKNATSHGKFLRDLVRTGHSDITDPYSGAKIISDQDFNNYKSTVCQNNDAREKVKDLAQYDKYLRPVEKGIYHMFIDDIHKMDLNGEHSKVSFQNILQRERPQALDRLEKKENKILDAIAEETKIMKPENAEMVLDKVNGAKYILENAGDQCFKRKDFIDSLVSMREAQKDNPNFKNIVKIANKLPTSNNSVDAFVVKYSNRAESEISERLLSSSLGTIEHVHPDSLGGKNAASNFILASSGSNTERGNMSFEDYKNMYPDIPKYMQNYIDDISRAAKKGKLFGHEWYPYVLKPELKKECNIDIDLTNYPIEDKEAFRTLPEPLQHKYPQYQDSYDRAIPVDDRDHNPDWKPKPKEHH